MSNFSVHEVNRIELVGKCKPSHNYIDFFLCRYSWRVSLKVVSISGKILLCVTDYCWNFPFHPINSSNVAAVFMIYLKSYLCTLTSGESL